MLDTVVLVIYYHHTHANQLDNMQMLVTEFHL